MKHTSEMRNSFIRQLRTAWVRSNSLLCVGLDPLLKRIPKPFDIGPKGVLDFCKAVVDVTHDYVCAFKPQHAHFAALGLEHEIEMLVSYIHKQYPGIPVILDAKRSDIGDTAARYAEEAFVRYDADAVTVNPYLGWSCVEQFLSYHDRGVLVLCRTSNADGDWIQSYPEEDPLYLRIARRVRDAQDENLLLVVGATFPKVLAQIRKVVGDVPLLTPGVGVQGAQVEEVLAAGRDSRGAGLIVNVSRSILYPDIELNSLDAIQNSARHYASILPAISAH